MTGTAWPSAMLVEEEAVVCIAWPPAVVVEDEAEAVEREAWPCAISMVLFSGMVEIHMVSKGPRGGPNLDLALAVALMNFLPSSEFVSRPLSFLFWAPFFLGHMAAAVSPIQCMVPNHHCTFSQMKCGPTFWSLPCHI